jgi:DNA-binding transcriptional regulator YdaS (Cro superfamily)
MLTEQEVIERLRAAVSNIGGQRRFAQTHGFTPAYVHDVLHGKRALADRILMAIGVKRTIIYQIEDQEQGVNNRL